MERQQIIESTAASQSWPRFRRGRTPNSPIYMFSTSSAGNKLLNFSSTARPPKETPFKLLQGNVRLILYALCITNTCREYNLGCRLGLLLKCGCAWMEKHLISTYVVHHKIDGKIPWITLFLFRINSICRCLPACLLCIVIVSPATLMTRHQLPSGRENVSQLNE